MGYLALGGEEAVEVIGFNQMAAKQKADWAQIP
jgi:hypothetical protein